MTEPLNVAAAPVVEDFDRRTIALTADFIGAALGEPIVLDGIPRGAGLVLLPNDDPPFVEESIAVGIEAVR